MRKIIYFAVSIAFISGCASTISEREVNSPDSQLSGEGKEIHLFFAANRRLELEPCGCAFWPIGGVVREFNAMKQEREKTAGHFAYLNSGTLFTPQKSIRLSEQQRLAKARTLIRAMNLLGVQVHSPSLQDMKYGLSQLESLKALSKFEWVGSNLISTQAVTGAGVPILKRFVHLQVGKAKVAVLGLMPKQVGRGWKTTDPVAALKDLLPQASKGADLVVVLSALSLEERPSILEIPGVHVVLGADEDEHLSGINQDSKQVLVGNPSDAGRALLHLAVRVPERFTGFFSSETANGLVFSRQFWNRWISEAREEKSRARTTAERNRLSDKISLYQDSLDRSATIPTAPGASTATFYSEDIKLSADYDGANALSELLSEYKEFTRKTAVGQLE